MYDLAKRCLVSLILAAAITLLILFSHCCIIAAVVVLAVAALAGIGVWEYARLVQAKHVKPATTLMIAVAIAEVLAFSYVFKISPLTQLPVIVLVVGVFASFIIHFKESSKALMRVAVEFFGVCYVAIPLSFMLGILFSSENGQDGRWWLFYLIIVTKMTDVGAYFVGRLWGKTPLAPSLSPKKTVEGAIAGFFSAVIASLALYFFGQQFAPESFTLSLAGAIALGVVLGIVGQLGDLAESLLKRDAVVKDSNRLPGLGGVLDMIDSLIFTTPVVYFFVTL